MIVKHTKTKTIQNIRGHYKLDQNMTNYVSADFRMHYGSIIGMTQYYRPTCLAKKEDRQSLVSFAEVDDTLLFDPSFPTQSLSCPDFDYHHEESDTKDEKFEKLSVVTAKKEQSSASAKEQTHVEHVNPTSANLCVQREKLNATKSNEKASKGGAKGLVETKTDKVRKNSASTVERDGKELVGSLFSFDAANEYVAPKSRSKEICMVIHRATDPMQKMNSTLERDRRQLGKAKNLVASRLAMFESRS